MKNLFITALMLIPVMVSAQVLNQSLPEYQYKIKATQSDIKIDGILDEKVWEECQVASDFWLQAPVDNEKTDTRTEVRMAYSENGLYISATCYDDQDYVIQSLKRDNFGESDEFSVVIDPINKKANGYAFGVNAMGAQAEALVIPDGADISWDNRWFVATERFDDHWTVEMFIPFKTLRFNVQNLAWGINFARIEPGKNETHVWAPIPRQFEFFDLGYCGKLEWDEIPGQAGANISFIPYTAFRTNKAADGERDNDFEMGGDAKFGLTNSLNLDLTFNPDFSQVEVDRQVTNLTRFSIFFPERRQFFIENNDLFNFGQGANQPFYSRRIGLDPFGRTVPILYGARLTGNISEKTRVGLFNIHSRTVNDVL